MILNTRPEVLCLHPFAIDKNVIASMDRNIVTDTTYIDTWYNTAEMFARTCPPSKNFLKPSLASNKNNVANKITIKIK